MKNLFFFLNGGSQYSEQGLRDWLNFKTPKPLTQDDSVFLHTVLILLLIRQLSVQTFSLAFFMVIIISSFVMNEGHYTLQEFAQCMG